jgi:hypothetical protein
MRFVFVTVRMMILWVLAPSRLVCRCLRFGDMKIRLLMTMNSIQNNYHVYDNMPSPHIYSRDSQPFSRPRAKFTPCYRLAGRKVYTCKWGKFFDMSLQFIKRILRTRLGLLLQTGSHIAQYFPLTISAISQIPETAFATVIFQYQV